MGGVDFSLPQRLPLVTMPGNRSSGFLKDSRLVNAYVERDLVDDDYWVEKRPGLSSPLYQLTGPGQGIFFWKDTGIRGLTSLLVLISNGDITVISQTPSVTQDQQFATLYDKMSTTGGGPNVFGPVYTPGHFGQSNPSLSPNSNIFHFCLVPASPIPYLVFSTGGSWIWYIGGPGTGTGGSNIHRPNYIPNSIFAPACPGIVYLDGTTYVMNTGGTLYGSKFLQDPSQWDPLNVLNAAIEPDGGVFLAKQLVYVVAIKQWTTEFFRDAGNTSGSPLASVPGAMFNYGCLSADTVQESEGSLLWVAKSKESGPQVLMVTALAPTIISTPAIDRFLASPIVNNPMTHFYSIVIKRGGHRFYVFTVIEANITLAYDIGQQFWYQWTDPDGNYWPIASRTYDIYGNCLLQDISSGSIYISDMDYTYPNDNGRVPPVDIYTPNYDGGVDRSKTLSMMRFNGDQTAGSKLRVRVSDDDYKTWSNFREVDLGHRRPILTDCGSFYRRAWHLRHQSNTAFRIKSADLQLALGTL